MVLHFSGDLTELLVTTVFSFLIGLELKTYRQQFHPEGGRLFFGTARTYTFIGILGFVFYRIDLTVYVAVLLALSGLYAILYSRKVGEGGSSILPYTVMLLVYSFGPVTQHFPFWMAALLFVLSVFLLNARDALSNVSRSIKLREFEILGKMVLLSAVILPLLPDTQEIPYLPISPFKLWLAVVVISGISYAGYLVQKYLFPRRGVFSDGYHRGYIATGSNNILKALYALWFGGWRAGRASALWIGLLGAVTIVLGVWDSLGFMLE